MILKKKQKQSIVSQQHEDTYCVIPSQAYENKPPPADWNQSANRLDAQGTSHLQPHFSHDQPSRSPADTLLSSTPSGRKPHTYDYITSEEGGPKLGYHSNSPRDLFHKAQQPNNQPVQEELKRAKIEPKAREQAEQERMLKMWNQKRDEQHKAESGGACNPPSSPTCTSHSGNDSSVDPHCSHHPSSGIYQNSPESNNSKPPNRAYAPPPQDTTSQQAIEMNSRVKFSDPPRYGVICWMGELPEVTGLIAGVEVVSYGILFKKKSGCEYTAVCIYWMDKGCCFLL